MTAYKLSVMVVALLLMAMSVQAISICPWDTPPEGLTPSDCGTTLTFSVMNVGTVQGGSVIGSEGYSYQTSSGINADSVYTTTMMGHGSTLEVAKSTVGSMKPSGTSIVGSATGALGMGGLFIEQGAYNSMCSECSGNFNASETCNSTGCLPFCEQTSSVYSSYLTSGVTAMNATNSIGISGAPYPIDLVQIAATDGVGMTLSKFSFMNMQNTGGSMLAENISRPTIGSEVSYTSRLMQTGTISSAYIVNYHSTHGTIPIL